MIKANELRIGNWVECFGKRFKKVDYLDIRDVAENRLVRPYEPIPLTNEILESCGFEIVGYLAALYVKSKGRGSLKKLELIIVRGVAVINNALHVECRYLHQLQNLFHALTGTELTIKL